jgi:hypothetical protein
VNKVRERDMQRQEISKRLGKSISLDHGVEELGLYKIRIVENADGIHTLKLYSTILKHLLNLVGNQLNIFSVLEK